MRHTTSRFASIRARSPSLRRIRTVFTTSSSSSFSDSMSPLSASSSPSNTSLASPSSMSSLKELFFLRRKPSVIDIELEEEKKSFAHELELLEPRPQQVGGTMGGIFEVLDGRF